MIRLPSFQFLAPRTLKDAIQMLTDAGDGAMLVAGGTDLYPNMKRLQVTPPTLISLRNVRELREVRRGEDGGLVIGAGITLTHLERHPLLRDDAQQSGALQSGARRRAHPTYGSLAAAIPLISTPPLRNMGTLGGNLCLDTRCHFINQTAFWRKAVGSCLKDVGDVCRVAPGSSRCWAISSADLPPLLIALGAQVQLVGARGERVIPLSSLYYDDGINYFSKARDEILTHVILPPGDGVRAGYLKLRRRGSFDFPSLGVAVAIGLNSDRTCDSARIVLGAVTSRPLDMPQAQTLVGEKLTDDLIASVADAIALQARPLQLADFTHSYRKQMIAVYVTRLLNQLAGQND